jgi:hypothetical protein
MHSFNRLLLVGTFAAALAAGPAFATAALGAADDSAGILAEGSVAPNVVAQSVVAGKVVGFDLKSELSTKVVVLYFFPLAFSTG